MTHPYCISVLVGTKVETYYSKEHVKHVKQEVWWMAMGIGVAIGGVAGIVGVLLGRLTS